MRICFILERGAFEGGTVFKDVHGLLEGRGAEVLTTYPDEETVRLDRSSPVADLYILNSATELALSTAMALENLGARVINSVNSNIMARDKVLASSVLMRNAIPTLRSSASIAEQLRTGSGFLSYTGNPGQKQSRSKIKQRLEGDLPVPEKGVDNFSGQGWFKTTCRSLKVFAIGDQVFGIRKNPAEGCKPVKVTGEVEDISVRCGKAFGLEFYGLDIKEDGKNIYVEGVNAFPGYNGVPDAAKRLSDYIFLKAK